MKIKKKRTKIAYISPERNTRSFKKELKKLGFNVVVSKYCSKNTMYLTSKDIRHEPVTMPEYSFTDTDYKDENYAKLLTYGQFIINKGRTVGKFTPID